jgi:hypothetical protein
MLALKYLLMIAGFGMILAAAGILGVDLYREWKYRRALTAGGGAIIEPAQWHWRTSLALACLAWGPILLALSIIVVPSGAVRLEGFGQPTSRGAGMRAAFSFMR